MPPRSEPSHCCDRVTALAILRTPRETVFRLSAYFKVICVSPLEGQGREGLESVRTPPSITGDS